MEEELNKVLDTAPEIEDMPDFGEETETTDAETQETTETAPAGEEKPTEEKGEDKQDKKDTKKEDKPKKETFKSNLPTGFSFNPLVMAIKPFYDKLIAEDDIFAKVVKERESRTEKPKSLSECADYIMSEAYNYASKHRNGNSGFAGFPDEDMYRLIRHYYDEEFLEVQKMTGARVAVATTPSAPAPAKTDKKGKEKPKDKPKAEKNVFDITKAIKSNTKDKEDGKKKEKKKDNLLAGFVPMERPNSYAEGKKGSRQQAKSVEQMDLFAGFFGD